VWSTYGGLGLYEKGAEDADTEMRTGLALSRLVFPCCLAVVGGGGAISKFSSRLQLRPGRRLCSWWADLETWRDVGFDWKVTPEPFSSNTPSITKGTALDDLTLLQSIASGIRQLGWFVYSDAAHTSW
jgi:hypothetical protein